MPGVEAVHDLLLKDLEGKSWRESDDLDLPGISQLIGFVLIKSFRCLIFRFLHSPFQVIAESMALAEIN